MALLLALAVALSCPHAAEARPEVTANLSLAYGRRSSPRAAREGLLSVGLTAMLLGDRESGSDFAAGALVSVGTADLHELDAALGPALLWPVNDALPLVVGAAPILVVGEDGARLGGALRIGWGAHSLPRLGSYVVSAGVFLEGRWLAGLGADRSRLDCLVGADLDAFALLWPAMFLWEAIVGRAPDD